MSALRVIASFLGAGVLGRAAVSLPSVSPPSPAPSVVSPLPAPSVAPADFVAAKREALRGTVAGYAGLSGDDFVNDYERPPAQIDVDNALAFIAYIPDRAVGTARAYCTGDPEIGFTWDAPPPAKQFFSVSFDEGGVMGYFGDLPDGRSILSDWVQYDKVAGPPDELRGLLSAIDF